MSDWVAAGHGRDELLTLVKLATPWEQPEVAAATVQRLTDLGNAERLIAAHGSDLRYHVNAEQWLHWTGVRWEQDETGTIHRLASSTIRGIAKDADALPSGDQRESLLKHMLHSENASRLAAMENLARFLLGVPVTAGNLDADPWAFNCLNGTLNLRTGELQPHRREDLLTKMSPVVFDPAATCPRWEQFLSEIFDNNDEIIGYMATV